MDGHPRIARKRGVGQNSAYRSSRWRERTVLVGAEDVQRDAAVADRGRGLEVAQGDRDLTVRQQAFHVIDPFRTGLDIDETAECAALDTVRRQVIGVGLRRDDGERQGHRGGLGLSYAVRQVDGSPLAAEPSTGIDATATRERY